jgi:hypothetical protein
VENVLYDTVRDLIEATAEVQLYDGSEFNDGYRAALYRVLSDIKIRIITYGLDVNEYFGDFDVDEWLKAGVLYRPR